MHAKALAGHDQRAREGELADSLDLDPLRQLAAAGDGRGVQRREVDDVFRPWRRRAAQQKILAGQQDDEDPENDPRPTSALCGKPTTSHRRTDPIPSP
jgi:hypothetical protein